MNDSNETTPKTYTLNPEAKEVAKSLSDFLDFLDTLPSPSKTSPPLFPYGDNEGRPYGWFLK